MSGLWMSEMVDKLYELRKSSFFSREFKLYINGNVNVDLIVKEKENFDYELWRNDELIAGFYSSGIVTIEKEVGKYSKLSKEKVAVFNSGRSISISLSERNNKFASFSTHYLVQDSRFGNFDVTHTAKLFFAEKCKLSTSFGDLGQICGILLMCLFVNNYYRTRTE